MRSWGCRWTTARAVMTNTIALLATVTTTGELVTAWS